MWPLPRHIPSLYHRYPRSQTPFGNTRFETPVSRSGGNETGVLRKHVPKQEFGNEGKIVLLKGATHVEASWDSRIGADAPGAP